jgi:hypothetical protein
LQAACEKLQVSVWQFWQLNAFLILLDNKIRNHLTARMSNWNLQFFTEFG